MAGRAAVVAGDFLEVVVDRQLGQADLLDLRRAARQVDAGQAAEPGERGRNTAAPSARASARPGRRSRVSVSCSFLSVVDVARAAPPSRPSAASVSASAVLELLRESLEQSLLGSATMRR